MLQNDANERKRKCKDEEIPLVILIYLNCDLDSKRFVCHNASDGTGDPTALNLQIAGASSLTQQRSAQGQLFCAVRFGFESESRGPGGT